METKREELVKTMQDQKTLEKLRGRHQEKQQQDLLRREARAVDDLVITDTNERGSTMLEPVMSKLQGEMYQSVFNELRELWANGLSGAGWAGASSLQACPSEFDDLITGAAQRHNLDPALLKAVAQIESNFSATAISQAGARG